MISAGAKRTRFILRSRCRTRPSPLPELSVGRIHPYSTLDNFHSTSKVTNNNPLSCSYTKMIEPGHKCQRYPRSKTNLEFSSRWFASTSAAVATDEEATTTDDQVPHIRNVAIIAHVDHGKTTIVDGLLRCAFESTLLKDNETGTDQNESNVNQEVENDGAALLMDCGDLERERGITITSKVTRLDYYDESSTSKTINVVDTPGHADFAGEVDRILAMIDGVCLVVDAAEGAMAQTKYVLSRALKLNLKPVVILNKCDKDDAWERIESGDVEMELLETFDSLGANDEQMEYVTVYASGKAGWATTDMDVARKLSTNGGVDSNISYDVSMKVLLDVILEHIPAPVILSPDDGHHERDEHPFVLTATTVGYDNFLGRLCTGRIYSGTIKKDDIVSVLPRDFSMEDNDSLTQLATSAVSGIFVTRGVTRTDLDPPIASAGDIVTLSGVPDSIKVGDTVTLKSNPIQNPMETPPINPPTLSMEFGANTGPFAGKEGTIVASSKVHDRLISETDNNVALNVSKSENDAEKTVVDARGELQLGILIETMRREGYELTVSPPNIITTECEETKEKLEPYEEVIIDVESEYSGVVVNSLTGSRKGVLMGMSDSSDGKTRLEFEVPSRGLLGFGNEIATATRGTAVVNHLFVENRKYSGHIGGNPKGKLVSNDTGKAALFALANIAKRGELFIETGDLVYPGMVIGENSRPGDLEVNAVRGKEVNNMRTVNKDEKLYVPPPKRLSVEELIGYMEDDEVIEVTPKSVRLRKAILDSKERERAARTRKKQSTASGKK